MEFLADLPLGPLIDSGGWAVAFGVVWSVARMVLTGTLVPRKTHEDTLKALEIERTRNELYSEQLGKMTDSMETFERFVNALPQPAQQTPPLPSLRGQQRRTGR